ncbi:hypothetical protein HL13_gp83 [Dinoroseobacter phage DFL12phi1]|uniref:Uncharacterized protein n=2 Tax=Baltimorevirus DFL12 TaxID=2169868 RepID=A0A023NG34_9CAUD|nr:hypothetical protein HL13_gp83 [Dinoroseobacter phage DFL12phi1]AHX01043.1 hypothetical protein DFL12P1_0083 [Dinoroseobacter phage DFL12phi1]AID16818.1 hypothetical protein vBDshPR2C_02 [Dinoroseobacter phage vBDshPR2C]
MSIQVSKLTDNRTLAQIHSQLMSDITACDNMIDPDDAEQGYQDELISEMEDMCEQLGMIEEVMSLKYAVDCDCFYTGGDHQ